MTPIFVESDKAAAVLNDLTRMCQVVKELEREVKRMEKKAARCQRTARELGSVTENLTWAIFHKADLETRARSMGLGDFIPDARQGARFRSTARHLALV